MLSSKTKQKEKMQGLGFSLLRSGLRAGLLGAPVRSSLRLFFFYQKKKKRKRKEKEIRGKRKEKEKNKRRKKKREIDKII